MQKLKNKPKKNLLNNKLYFNLLFLIIIFSLMFYYKNNIEDYAISKINNVSTKYGLILNEINITNNKNIPKYFFEKELKNYFNKPIFFIPLKKIKSEYLNNSWIESIDLEVSYPSTINISVKEKNPISIYFDNKNYYLIDANANIIEKTNTNNYSNLIFIEGDMALDHASELIKNLKNYINLKITSAVFIEKRRWNIIIDKKLIIKLPAENYSMALKNLSNVFDKLENFDYNLIESVDLRIEKKAIIKFYDNDDFNLLDNI